MVTGDAGNVRPRLNPGVGSTPTPSATVFPTVSDFTVSGIKHTLVIKGHRSSLYSYDASQWYSVNPDQSRDIGYIARCEGCGFLINVNLLANVRWHSCCNASYFLDDQELFTATIKLCKSK